MNPENLEKELLFIKLGGAAITHKNVPNKENTQVLDQTALEIKSFYKDYKLLIGHGGGSFAHPVAEKYKAQEGLKVCGLEGFAETQKAAQALNKIVVDNLVEHKIPAIPVQTSACTLATNGQIKEIHTELITELLAHNLIPVIYGDIIIDEVKGCTIASTEMILSYLAPKLKPKRIIIGTDVDGVFTKDPKKGKGTLIKEINEKNLNEVLETLEGAKTTDVTGGMAHKIKELYNLSKLEIEIDIINITKKDYLKRAVNGENLGTKIKLSLGK